MSSSKTISVVTSQLGLGHVARQIALKDQLLKSDPDVNIRFICSKEQDSIMRRAILTDSRVTIEHIPASPKATMDNWYELDGQSTIDSFQKFIDFDTQIREDREWERIFHGTHLVINDIESIHNPIASKMSIPIINISNFTWSDILFSLGADELTEDYIKLESMADLNLKLPFNNECRGFTGETKEVGILSREVDQDIVDQIHSLTTRPLVYLSYSGKNWNLELNEITQELQEDGNKIIIQDRFGRTLDSVDYIGVRLDEPSTQSYIAAADVIISKIGYSTLTEAMIGGTNLLYWKRYNYIEDDKLSQAVLNHGVGEEIPIGIGPTPLKIFVSKYRDRKINSITTDNENIANIILEFLN